MEPRKSLAAPGLSFQSVRSHTLEPPSSHPAYTYNGSLTAKPGIANTGSGLADFMTNNMSGGSIGPSGIFNNAQDNISAYAQDDWRLTQKLTLNLGVRYDHFQPYKEMAWRMANFYATSAAIGTGTGVYALPAQTQGKLAINPKFLALLAKDHIDLVYDSNPRLTEAQDLNFAPRIGFAYARDPKTVIRGGFGIFYQGQQQGGAAVTWPRTIRSYSAIISPPPPATPAPPIAPTTVTRLGEWFCGCASARTHYLFLNARACRSKYEFEDDLCDGLQLRV